MSESLKELAEAAAWRLADDYEATRVQEVDGFYFVDAGHFVDEDRFVQEAQFMVTRSRLVQTDGERRLRSGGRLAGPELSAELRAEYRDDERGDV